MRGVTLPGTEPRATVPVSFRSPTLGAGPDGISERRVSSVPGSVTPRVTDQLWRGLGYGLLFSLPVWTVVVYATVRGVW